MVRDPLDPFTQVNLDLRIAYPFAMPPEQGAARALVTGVKLDMEGPPDPVRPLSKN